MRSDTMTIQDLVHQRRVPGTMLSVCPSPGCTTLTMGGTCVEHDAPVTAEFPRGRPFPPHCAEAVTVDGRSVAHAPVA